MGGLAVDLVVCTQSRFKFIHILIAEPVEKGRITETIATSGKKDNRSPFFNRATTVIEGFLGLDKIDVFGLATTGDDGQVGSSGNRHAVEGAHQLTAGQVCL